MAACAAAHLLKGLHEGLLEALLQLLEPLVLLLGLPRRAGCAVRQAGRRIADISV